MFPLRNATFLSHIHHSPIILGLLFEIGAGWREAETRNRKMDRSSSLSKVQASFIFFKISSKLGCFKTSIPCVCPGNINWCHSDSSPLFASSNRSRVVETKTDWYSGSLCHADSRIYIHPLMMCAVTEPKLCPLSNWPDLTTKPNFCLHICPYPSIRPFHSNSEPLTQQIDTFVLHNAAACLSTHHLMWILWVWEMESK